jgi:hypothetical protein
MQLLLYRLAKAGSDGLTIAELGFAEASSLPPQALIVAARAIMVASARLLNRCMAFLAVF